MVAAESSNSPVRDEADIVATIEAYNMGVAMYTAEARALLPAHDGYECKEPEPGKFTLAFRREPSLLLQRPRVVCLVAQKQARLRRRIVAAYLDVHLHLPCLRHSAWHSARDFTARL